MKILILDDDPVARRLIAHKVQKLADHGPMPIVVVSESGSLSCGLQMVEDANPDVVLLDLHLEDAMPAQTIACIRRLAAKAAVVVISASEEPTIIQAAMNAGAQDYLHKDTCWTNPAMMIQTIERAYQRFAATRHQACDQIISDIQLIKKALKI